MLNIILDAYKLFLRKFPIILLYALPLLILSGISVYFQNLGTENRGVLYFLYGAFFLIPLVSAATDISIYQRLMNFRKVNPLASAKIFVLYLVVQIALGLVATLPMFIFFYILSFITASTLAAITLAAFFNIFVGLYFLARFNIILPLIIKDQVPSLQSFMAYTKNSYRQWLAAAALIYLPYIVINYLFVCPYGQMLATNLFMFVLLCFNVSYINDKGEKHEKPHRDTTLKTPLPVKENVKAPQKKAVAKPAPKKVVKKPVPKPAPTGKKAPVKKKASIKAPKLKPVTA